MDIGLLFRWGRAVPGREEQAVGLFGEVLAYFEEQKAAGRVTFFEPFFFSTSDRDIDQGLMIVKGPVAEIFKMVEEEPFIFIADKAMLLLEHYQMDYLAVGDTVMERLGAYSKARAEVGV